MHLKEIFDLFMLDRPVAQLAEQRSPKPQVGGSIPSWPAMTTIRMLKVSSQSVFKSA